MGAKPAGTPSPGKVQNTKVPGWNDTNAPLVVSGIFAASAVGGINAASITAPVPEPSTYALMAAGVGMVGFVARRCRPR
nr:PEP-CTERM sorting domain-containing protein [Azohydromonas australica]